VLDDCHATSLGDDERVEDEHRERNDAEHEQLCDPRPDRPDGPDAVRDHLLTHGTVARLSVELPEVGLDEVQQHDADPQQDDDDHCALSCAELFTSERMTHADVPLYTRPVKHSLLSTYYVAYHFVVYHLEQTLSRVCVPVCD